MTVPMVSKFIAAPLALATLLVPGVIPALCLAACVQFMRFVSLGPDPSSVQGLVRPEIRPTAAAELMFAMSVIGLGLGPLGVGILSDVMAGLGRVDGLRASLMCAEGVGLLGALLYLRARRIYPQEVES